MKNYFIHDGQAEKGPYTFEEIMSLKLSKMCPIWHEGLEGWTTLDKLEEFKEHSVFKVPPPFSGNIQPQNEPKKVEPPKYEPLIVPPVLQENSKNLYVYLYIGVILLGFLIFTIDFYRFRVMFTMTQLIAGAISAIGFWGVIFLYFKQKQHIFIALGASLVSFIIMREVLSSYIVHEEPSVYYNNTPAVTQPATTPTTDEIVYAGTYVSGEGKLIIKKPKKNGKMSFSAFVATESGCTGELSGSAYLVSTTNAVYNKDCSLVFVFSGNSVSISENSNCPHHGANCSFSGTYYKQ